MSGQRLISGGVTDAMVRAMITSIPPPSALHCVTLEFGQEAAALSYRNDLNHIYSCSWGA